MAHILLASGHSIDLGDDTETIHVAELESLRRARSELAALNGFLEPTRARVIELENALLSAQSEIGELKARISAMEQSYREARAMWPEGMTHSAWAELVQANRQRADAAGARIKKSDELLIWAMNQMRRAARTIELLAIGGTLTHENGKNIYSQGLDECADAVEVVLSKSTPEKPVL